MVCFPSANSVLRFSISLRPSHHLFGLVYFSFHPYYLMFSCLLTFWCSYSCSWLQLPSSASFFFLIRGIFPFTFFKNYFYLFIYLFMAVLGLRFCARAFSSCGKWGPLFIAMRGPLTITASLVAEHRLQTRRSASFLLGKLIHPRMSSQLCLWSLSATPNHTPSKHRLWSRLLGFKSWLYLLLTVWL